MVTAALVTAEFFLVGHPPTTNELKNLNRYRRNSDRQVWKDAAYLLAHSTGGKPFDPARVTATFCYRLRRKRDFDNMVASLKPVLDGMRGVLLVDDDTEHLSELVLRYEVGERDGILIRVERAH